MVTTSRRSLLKTAVAASALGFPMVARASHQVSPKSSSNYSTRAIDLVRQSLVIDMLAPLTLDFRPERWAETLSAEQVAEYRASGINVFHHSYGMIGQGLHEKALRYMASWNGFIARNSNLFQPVTKAADIDYARQSGKISVILGIQNSEHFRTPDDVLLFHQLGQRCSQLTYNAQNLIGSGSTERIDGGVTDFGLEIIRQMNKLGMLIDVSHSGDRTTLDAIELSTQPIAITHSNCRALNNHPRLKTDEAILKLAAKGGVIGISEVRNFVRDREPTTVEHMVDHIDHVAKLVGIEFVGIGSDSDLHGYDDMRPEANADLRSNYKESYRFRKKMDTDGFDHPLKTYDLVEVLIRRGYSDAHIRAVLGGNFRRLLGQVWG